MSVLEFFQWVQATPAAAALRGSALTYPIIMTAHLTGMGLFGGMIAITDARLLGFAMRKYPIADVVNQLRVWKRIGGALVITCGFMLWASKAEFYIYNPYYWAKMALLLLVGIHALVFRSVYKNPEALDAAPAVPRKAKVAAWMSIFLWVGLVAAGRLIGYWDVPDRLRPKY
jgi:uncharacterized membrane protein